MRRLFRRPILWLLPVVILPLGTLLILQVRFLRSLEQKTVSAERNWLRNSLELVTQEVEARYRSTSEAALTLREGQAADVTHIGAHFGKQHVPGARTYFSMRFKGEMADAGFFDARGVEKHPLRAEAEAVKMATVSWHVAHRWNRMAEPRLYVDERDPQNRIILRPILDASWHVAGVAGVILDEKLAQAAMTAIGTKMLRQRDAPTKNIVVLRVADRFPRHCSVAISSPSRSASSSPTGAPACATSAPARKNWPPRTSATTPCGPASPSSLCWPQSGWLPAQWPGRCACRR